MKKIFYVMGKSASGKDSISRFLAARYSLKEIVLYTTRPMRAGETEGVQYHFTSIPRFQELLEKNCVIEYRCYNTVQGDWYYYTVFDSQFSDDGSGDSLIIGTLESYVTTKHFLAERGEKDLKLIPIYIEVENGTRLMRALKREMEQAKPDYAELCRRFLADEQDFSEEKLGLAGISKRYVNDDMEACLAKIGADIDQIGS